MIFFLRLWWLKHRRKSLIHDYDKDVAELVKANDHEGVERLEQESSWEVRRIEDRVLQLETGHYIEKARQLGLPTPEFNKELWEENINHLGSYHLTRAEVAKLRSAIRQDKKEIREAILPILAMIVSIIALFVSIMSYRRTPVPRNTPQQQQSNKK